MYIHPHSPTGTSASHGLGGETGVTTTTNAGYDKVVYAAPAQTVTVPHQASAAGEMYAVSTKAANKKKQEQPPPQEHVDVDDTKKNPQGVSSSS